MICSSLNRFRFMSVLPEQTQLYYVRVPGEQVISTSVSSNALALLSKNLWGVGYKLN